MINDQWNSQRAYVLKDMVKCMILIIGNVFFLAVVLYWLSSITPLNIGIPTSVYPPVMIVFTLFIILPKILTSVKKLHRLRMLRFESLTKLD